MLILDFFSGDTQKIGRDQTKIGLAYGSIRFWSGLVQFSVYHPQVIQYYTKLDQNDHWPKPHMSNDFDLHLTFDLDTGVKYAFLL